MAPAAESIIRQAEIAVGHPRVTSLDGAGAGGHAGFNSAASQIQPRSQ